MSTLASICTTMRRQAGLVVILFLTIPAIRADYLNSFMSRDDPWRIIVKSFKYSYPDRWQAPVAVVNTTDQRLYLYEQGKLVREYPVSTSRYGVGNEDGSYKTPLGLHRVVNKIGYGVPMGTIFKNRESTGEIAKIYKSKIIMPFDFITTRILQLEGLEPGKNKGSGIDTLQRSIYIHGTHEEGMIGQPASLGCVRMYNKDVIELFRQMPENALVLIVQDNEPYRSASNR